jgi:CDP-glucose 4,6-dehydratase
MVDNSKFWSGKKVFLTGHTGFKGSWLSHWLSQLGSKVYGYSLQPPTKPSLFDESKVKYLLSGNTYGDVRDFQSLSAALEKARPEIVIHMAAQPLVRESYKTPVDTFAVNVLGTVNVLEASRNAGTVQAIVNITTDKCYENKEWLWPYRENDRLGGHDPYSASKACSEIVAASYRNSFLTEAGIHLASVRAGNVVGGGDWATDRLIPDIFRAIDRNETLIIRSPNAIRPWQHVLEPLSGYLLLAQKLYEHGEKFSGAWNFGPNDEDTKPVSWVVDRLCTQIPGSQWKTKNAKQLHEAGLLKLDSSKAKTKLGWAPRWNLETALTKTVKWHQAWNDKEDVASVTCSQIFSYQDSLTPVTPNFEI